MKIMDGWYAGFLAIGLFQAGWIVFLYRRDRRTFMRFRAWADRESLKVQWVRRASEFNLPRKLRRDPRNPVGLFYFKFRAARSDGATRTGLLRLPQFENRFAPPILVHWMDEGPSFDDFP